jgi:hypothetical protein
VLLFLFGVLLLLATTGVLAIDLWGLLIPTLLIALGVFTLWMAFTRSGALERAEAHVELDGATEAEVKLRFGAGRLNVGPGARGNDLAEVDALGGVAQRAATSGGRRSADFWVPGSFLADVLAPWKWANREPPAWDVRLREAVPLDLEVQAGACEINLELTSLVVRELRLLTGASSVRLHLPAGAGETRAHITAGAAGVIVRVPPGVAARVRVPTGLGEVKVDLARFPGGDGRFESPGFAEAANRVDLSVEVGAASVEIA